MAAQDYRFSMAESEWSRDESDEEVRYTTSPVSNGNQPVSRNPMYDLPPDVAPRVQLSTADAENERVSVKVTENDKSKRKTPDFKRSSHKVKCWVKIYIAILTVMVLILAVGVGFLSYQFLKPPSNTSTEPTVTIRPTHQISINGRSSSTDSKSDIEALVKRTDALEDVMDNILRLLESKNIRQPTNMVDLKEKGCRSSDVRVNSSCYSINIVTPTVIQIQAVINCQSRGGHLAMMKHKNIQDSLEGYISVDGIIWWVDGYKRDNKFKFADKSLLPSNQWRNITGEGNCLALRTKSNDVAWLKRDCNNGLNGYICQYPVSKS